jgi:transposase
MVGRDSFYGFLASQRGELFRDEDFAELYCAHNGRDSVPPSLLVTVLLLQTYERVSDEEAKARADFDLRWKVALGLRIEDQPFAKSTLQLILHEKMRDVFERSLSFARETGYLKRKKVKVALDTSFILGRGAVKDTYNLLADGIVQLMRVLARLGGENKYMWARQHNLGRYLGRSVKGESQVDWDDMQARQAFLASVVADADHLLETARQVVDKHAPESEERKRVTEAAALLGQLLLQDVERSAGTPSAGWGGERPRGLGA